MSDGAFRAERIIRVPAERVRVTETGSGSNCVEICSAKSGEWTPLVYCINWAAAYAAMQRLIEGVG